MYIHLLFILFAKNTTVHLSQKCQYGKMLIILYCVLFNHNSSVFKGYRLRVTIYNDQIKRLVSKSMVPCTNRKLGIFKATMRTKGRDKDRAPLFRWKLTRGKGYHLINYTLTFRRLHWMKYHWKAVGNCGKGIGLYKNHEIRTCLYVGWADVTGTQLLKLERGLCIELWCVLYNIFYLKYLLFKLLSYCG